MATNGPATVTTNQTRWVEGLSGAGRLPNGGDWRRAAHRGCGFFRNLDGVTRRVVSGRQLLKILWRRVRRRRRRRRALVLCLLGHGVRRFRCQQRDSRSRARFRGPGGDWHEQPRVALLRLCHVDSAREFPRAVTRALLAGAQSGARRGAGGLLLRLGRTLAHCNPPDLPVILVEAWRHGAGPAGPWAGCIISNAFRSHISSCYQKVAYALDVETAAAGGRAAPSLLLQGCDLRGSG